MPEKEKLKCENWRCGWTGTEDEKLIAPNPFDPENDILIGCPVCLDVNCLGVCCDEPGCWELVSTGTPTPEGYRSTCYKHRPVDRASILSN